MKTAGEVVVLDVKSQRECVLLATVSGCQPHGIWDKAVHVVLVIMMPWIMGRLSIKNKDCHPMAACFHLPAFLLRSHQRIISNPAIFCAPSHQFYCEQEAGISLFR
jgi:hypothetical protein